MRKLRPILIVSLLTVFLRTSMAQGTERRFQVIGVLVHGNKVTKERVIYREITFGEGDSLTSAELYPALERSQENLINTGLFNTAVLLPVFISKDQVLVEVTVNERWYWWPSPIIEVADPNFNTWWRTREIERLNLGFYLYRYNFRGRNETLYAKAQFGYAQQYGLYYKVPFVDRKERWGFQVGGGYYQQNEITVATEENDRIFYRPISGNSRKEWNLHSEATLRRAHDIRHAFGIRFTSAEVLDTVAAQRPDYFGDGSTATSFLSLRYTFIRDRRDTRAYTLKGDYAEASVVRHGLGVLDRQAPDITVFYATYGYWLPLATKWTLAGSLRGKATLGGPVPYYVQEGLGYRHYVRGYEYYVVDGQHYGLGKLNVLFQLLAPRTERLEFMPLEPFRTLHIALYLNAYVDAGHVFDDQYAQVNPLSNSTISGFGLGLDLVTSYDQVARAEYSINARGEHGFFLHFTHPF
ncbi:MAG: hypothetical protein KDB88_08350 [Flavobacteriales bacterium]|nr:hypothetical protein [Flavobacteriales bacterium]